MSTPKMDKRRRTNGEKMAKDIMSLVLRGSTSRWCVFGGDHELAACFAKKYGGAAQCKELIDALADEIACAYLGGRLLMARQNGQSHYALPK